MMNRERCRGRRAASSIGCVTRWVKVNDDGVPQLHEIHTALDMREGADEIGRLRVDNITTCFVLVKLDREAASYG